MPEASYVNYLLQSVTAQLLITVVTHKSGAVLDGTPQQSPQLGPGRISLLQSRGLSPIHTIDAKSLKISKA